MTTSVQDLKPLHLKAVQRSASTSILPASKGHVRILLCATGSVATIKIANIIQALSAQHDISIRLIFTESARKFLCGQSAEQPSLAEVEAMPNVEGIYFDEDEWSEPWVRGNKILHIELRRWADIMLIVPLSANSLAKIAQGWADNLLLSVVRAWDTTGALDPVRGTGYDARAKKRILVAPSMNTAMWAHPVTKKHLAVLEDEWGVAHGGWFEVLAPMEKELACGDVGAGAMKDWREIVSILEERLDRLRSEAG